MVRHANHLHRIIPARAGFTPLRRGWRREWWDHPRSRGVYLSQKRRIRSLEGSSPLARGLHGLCGRAGERHRIIPARAGFTPSSHYHRLPISDHPRSRGVYISSRGPASTQLGSSPLARGLRPSAEPERDPERIIPARAGFTRSVKWGASHSRDHPRSRGVYALEAIGSGGCVGSSPLARGLLPPIPATAGYTGIIPARAGFTSGPPTAPRTPPDHPRSRGVYPEGDMYLKAAEGSSPLARGLH